MNIQMWSDMPLLSLLVAAPLLAALCLLLVPDRLVRLTAKAGVLAQGALALAVLAAFNPDQTGFQLVEHRLWMPEIGAGWHVGIDGLAVLFPLAITLLDGVLIAHARSPFIDRPRVWMAWVLMMGGVLTGLVVSLDLVLFFLFWELTLPPMHALLAGWGGGPDRRYAAARYTITMLAGGVPLLLGLAVLATAGDGVQTDITVLTAHRVPERTQWIAGGLILVGLAFKLPVVPLHTWLPWTLTEGRVGVGTWMVGLKIGAFGLLRLVLPLTPTVITRTGPLLGLVGLVGLLHGAFVALEQRGLRRLIAFTSVSHVGLVLLGVASATVEGMQGAILQLLTFSVSAPLLVLLSGMLIDRLGTTDLDALGGLGTAMPRWSVLLVLSVLAGIGFPGTSGFVAEQLLLFGTFVTHPGLAVLAVGGLVIGVAAVVSWVAGACGGPVSRPAVAQVDDLTSREVAELLPLLAVCVLVGLIPGPVLHLSERTVAGLLEAPAVGALEADDAAEMAPGAVRADLDLDRAGGQRRAE